MKVIISGSESFVARHLITECKRRGIEVQGFDVAEPQNPDYTFVKADTRDANLSSLFLKNADAVIHLAALSRDPDCKGKAYECFDANVMATLNVLRAAKASGAKQLIFASSEWVYDSFKPGEEKDEEAPIDIRNLTSEYALSKFVSEANFRQEHAQSGFPITALRFAIIYGPRPRNWAAVESLASKVKRGERIQVGSLSTGRRFIHVSDIVSGILSAIGTPGFEVINLSGDKLITLGDVITTSEKLFNTKATVEETDPKNISVRNPSNKKAKKLLSWSPKVPLSEGLKSVAEFL